MVKNYKALLQKKMKASAELTVSPITSVIITNEIPERDGLYPDLLSYKTEQGSVSRMYLMGFPIWGILAGQIETRPDSNPHNNQHFRYLQLSYKIQISTSQNFSDEKIRSIKFSFSARFSLLKNTEN